MITKTKTRLTDTRDSFKPFNYPWAYDAWLKHEQAHWLHSEVPMAEDVKDWKKKLTNEEKKFLTNIFRFFTQGDIDVAGGLRIKHKFPEQTLAVFVKPPSVDELKRRLKERSTESEDKINMRIAKAHVELATAPQFDTIIKNYDLDVAKEEAYELVKEFVK